MITLDLTPTEEARISTVARQIGLAPAEYVKKLVTEHLPPAAAAPTVDEENQALIALLQSWREEDATDDPQELQRRDDETNTLLSNLQSTRLSLREPEAR